MAKDAMSISKLGHVFFAPPGHIEIREELILSPGLKLLQEHVFRADSLDVNNPFKYINLGMKTKFGPCNLPQDLGTYWTHCGSELF